MAHDDDAVALADLVCQGVGNDAAAHMAALFDTMGNAAEELKAIDCFHGSLVAAAAQGNINAFAGHLLAFLHSSAAMAYADGKGEHSAGVQRTHFIQNIKAFFHHPADIPLFHHRNIAAVGHLAQETGRAADVFFQQGVDGLQLVRLLGVLHIVEQLVIAVHPNNQVSRAAGSVFIQRVFVECIVDQKQQCARFAAAAGCGVGRVAVFVNGQVLAVGAGADGKVNAGHQAVRCSQQGILPRQDLLPEGRIIPHHGAFGNQGSGDGKICQRILGLAALKVGPAQHIGHKAPQPADAKHRHHQRKHYKQRRCQQPARVAERQRHSQSDARNEQQKDNDKDITS